jgi:hypothetical protein
MGRNVLHTRRLTVHSLVRGCVHHPLKKAGRECVKGAMLRACSAQSLATLTAGKDRTGLIVALLLLLLGVEEDAVIEDYAMSFSELKVSRNTVCPRSTLIGHSRSGSLDWVLQSSTNGILPRN